MEKKKNNTLLICTLIILLIASIVALCAVHMSKKGSETSQVVSNTITESEPLELNINDNLVIQLSKIPLKYNNIGINDESKIDGQFKESFYKDEKVSFDTLSEDEKIITVLNNVNDQDIEIVSLQSLGAKKFKAFQRYTDEEIKSWYYDLQPGEELHYGGMNINEVKVYKHDVIEETALRIFGEDGKNINWKSLYSGGMGYEVEYIDGNYYWYHYFGGGLGNCTYGYSELEKATQTNDYIYLYDKYVFYTSYDSDVNNGKDKCYKSSTMNNELLDIISSNHNGEYSNAEICKNILDNNKDRFNTYKHTFKKDVDGNYYWVSTEIAN